MLLSAGAARSVAEHAGDMDGLFILFSVFLVAGAVKGVVGMGLPTVAIGLLGLVTAPAEAAALMLVPSLATNLWQFAAGPHARAVAARLSLAMAAIFVATILATGLIAGAGAERARLALGIVLVLYALVGLLGLRLPVWPKAQSWAGPLAGAATGLLTGATGVFVLPIVPYLAGLGLAREALIQAMGLAFTVATLALAVGLHLNDALPAQALGLSTLAVAPAVVGMMLGAALRKRIRPETFRTVLFVGLGLLGAQLALASVTAP